MSSPDQDPDQRVVAVLLVATIVLAVGLALGVGISRTGNTAPAPALVGQPLAAAVVAAPDAPAAAPAPAGDASVVVDSGVVKFYFASGNAELPSGALAALDGAIAAAQAGQRLVLSGYHDATGNAALNAELARQRALAVRHALVGAGVPESSLEVKRPAEALGNGNDAEARRVEVVIGG